MDRENRTAALLWCKMDFFLESVVEGKSAVTPLSCWLRITTDETFKMRYITSLNSKWFQKYESLKLKNEKPSDFLT